MLHFELMRNGLRSDMAEAMHPGINPGMVLIAKKAINNLRNYVIIKTVKKG